MLIDARSVKNLQVRASRRVLKKANIKEIPEWCNDLAAVKAKVEAPETRCEFFEACVKAAVPATADAARCERLKALADVGEAGLGVRDLYLCTAAAAIVPLLAGADAEVKITEAVNAVMKDNFGTAANNAAEPPAAVDPAVVPPAEPVAVPEPATAVDPAAASEKPVVENNAKPTFCALPRLEQLEVMTAWMTEEKPTMEQVEAKIGEVSCPEGAEFRAMLTEELVALKTKAVDTFEKVKTWAADKLSGAEAFFAGLVQPVADQQPVPVPDPAADKDGSR